MHVCVCTFVAMYVAAANAAPYLFALQCDYFAFSFKMIWKAGMQDFYMHASRAADGGVVML